MADAAPSTAAAPAAAAGSGGSGSGPPYKLCCMRGNNANIVREAFQRRAWWQEIPCVEEVDRITPTGLPRQEAVSIPPDFNFLWRPGNFVNCQHAEWNRSPRYAQMVNHFEFIRPLCTKHGLLRSLVAYYTSLGKCPWLFIPPTFVLESGNGYSIEVQQFRRRFREIASGHVRQGMGLASKHCAQNVWVVKPVASNQGRGIELFADIQSVFAHCNSGSSGREWIVQKYVERPLLIQNRKFDVRVWALVTPDMSVYVYREGYLRTSADPYSFDLSKLFVHLTNHCLQKFSPNLGKYEEGNTLNFRQFQEYLDEFHSGANINFRQHLWTQMLECIADSQLAVKHILNSRHRKHTFELFGYDFLVDEDFKVWLLEVNTNPFLGVQNRWHAALLPKMVDDMLRLTADVQFPPPAGTVHQPVEFVDPSVAGALPVTENWFDLVLPGTLEFNALGSSSSRPMAHNASPSRPAAARGSGDVNPYRNAFAAYRMPKSYVPPVMQPLPLDIPDPSPAAGGPDVPDEPPAAASTLPSPGRGRPPTAAVPATLAPPIQKPRAQTAVLPQRSTSPSPVRTRGSVAKAVRAARNDAAEEARAHSARARGEDEVDPATPDDASHVFCNQLFSVTELQASRRRGEMPAPGDDSLAALFGSVTSNPRRPAGWSSSRAHSLRMALTNGLQNASSLKFPTATDTHRDIVQDQLEQALCILQIVVKVEWCRGRIMQDNLVPALMAWAKYNGPAGEAAEAIRDVVIDILCGLSMNQSTKSDLVLGGITTPLVSTVLRWLVSGAGDVQLVCNCIDALGNLLKPTNLAREGSWRHALFHEGAIDTVILLAGLTSLGAAGAISVGPLSQMCLGGTSRGIDGLEGAVAAVRAKAVQAMRHITTPELQFRQLHAPDSVTVDWLQSTTAAAALQRTIGYELVARSSREVSPTVSAAAGSGEHEALPPVSGGRLPAPDSLLVVGPTRPAVDVAQDRRRGVTANRARKHRDQPARNVKKTEIAPLLTDPPMSPIRSTNRPPAEVYHPVAAFTTIRSPVISFGGEEDSDGAA